MGKYVLLILQAVIFLFVACINNSATHNIKKLRSGKEIKVLGVEKIYFKDGTSAMSLNYQTNLPLDDKKTLRAEAEQIWEDFRNEVEKEGFTKAFISAHQPATGFIVQNAKGYRFLYEKQADGTWQLFNNATEK